MVGDQDPDDDRREQHRRTDPPWLSALRPSSEPAEEEPQQQAVACRGEARGSDDHDVARGAILPDESKTDLAVRPMSTLHPRLDRGAPDDVTVAARALARTGLSPASDDELMTEDHLRKVTSDLLVARKLRARRFSVAVAAL